MNGARAGGLAVVTDTTSYVPEALLDLLAVERVSLYVGWDGDLQPESSYTDLDAFYARLAEAPTLPRTSQPSVGDFVDIYRPLVAAGREVLSIHIASGLSGTCDSARAAAEALEAEGHPGTVTVHDAQTGAGGLGCLVLAAAAAAAAGAGAAEALRSVLQTRESLDMWFCLDTLEYLRKGGRIGAAGALIGTALKIKPILTFGTEIAPVAKVRTHRRALEHMQARLEQLRDGGCSHWMVQHAQAPGDAQRLVDAGREAFGTDPLFCTEVGPVLGAHLGAGVLVGGARIADPAGALESAVGAPAGAATA